MSTLVIPNMAEVSAEAKPQTEEAEKSLAIIKDLPVTTIDELLFSVQIVAEAKSKFNAGDTKRKSKVAPLNKYVKGINDEYRPGLDFLKEAEAILKEKVSGFIVGQAGKRRKQIAMAANAVQAGEPEKADALIEAADDLEIPKIPGVSVTEKWVGEVIDADEIPREYMIPDLKALAALTKAKKSNTKILGWNAYPNTSVTITVSKIKGP